LALKLLLKRGALLAAANWQTVAIQFAAETTFQMMLAVPLVGAAVLVAVLLGADVGNLLQGSFRETFSTIATALVAEPVALAAFVASFVIVLVGGSVLTFLTKGGTIEVLMAANESAGPIESEPVTWERLQTASRFSVERFLAGSRRLFRRYLTLGLLLMVVYGLSGAGYLAFVLIGYRTAVGRVVIIGWTLVAALAAAVLVAWITLVNILYLLLQIAIAIEDVGIVDACRVVARLTRVRFRELGGVFLVVLVMIVGATVATALALSGVGLIAFVPLIGLVVLPLQIVAMLLRGLVFEYIGLSALGAYLTMYRRHAADLTQAVARASLRRTPAEPASPHQAS
jgi:hypothetical protein